jgi:hypothetical protein
VRVPNSTGFEDIVVRLPAELVHNLRTEAERRGAGDHETALSALIVEALSERFTDPVREYILHAELTPPRERRLDADLAAVVERFGAALRNLAR